MFQIYTLFGVLSQCLYFSFKVGQYHLQRSPNPGTAPVAWPMPNSYAAALPEILYHPASGSIPQSIPFRSCFFFCSQLSPPFSFPSTSLRVFFHFFFFFLHFQVTPTPNTYTHKNKIFPHCFLSTF